MMGGSQIVTVKLRVPKDWDRKQVRNYFGQNSSVKCETIKMPNKPGSGGKKGTGWERDFAKMLSSWWSGDTDQHIFAHRSGSGGARRDKRGESGHSGDIFADKIDGLSFTNRYSMELKFYADLSSCVWALFTCSSTKQLDEFWDQAIDAAAPYNRFVLLILRTNNREPLVITDDLRLSDALNGIIRSLRGTAVGIFPLSDLLTCPRSVIGSLSSNIKTAKRFNR